MSITEELRTYAQGYKLTVNHKLLEIADRIDRSYKNALECARDDGYEDGYQDSCAKQAEQGLVKLPVDADGEVIHLGDEVYHFNDAPGHHSSVKALELTENGWMVDRGCKPSHLRHWKAPTVEDLLADVANRAANLTGSYHEGGMNGDEYMDSMRALVAEYAERIKEAVRDA